MKKYFRHWLTLVVCIFLSKISYAQLNNSFFYIERNDSIKNQFNLHIENIGYFRNVEYTNAIDEGRTLFGYQFWPEMTYGISQNAQIAGGVFVQKDFGSSGFYKIAPTFSFQYKKKQHTLRFGNVLGSVQHGLIEPLYDPERIIENRNENGFQYLLKAKKLKGEFWIDWTKMIYPNSPFREEFTVGTTLEPTIISKKAVKLSLPVAALAFHKGGEIDTSKMPTQSNFNFDYGIRLISKIQKLDSFVLEFHALDYEDISTTPENFIDGLGQYAAVSAYKNQWGLMLNYWDSHQFYNPMGDAIYRTVSSKNPNYILNYRKMAMARLFFQTNVAENLDFLLRSNFVYDMNQKTTGVIAEFYIRWHPKYTL
ncbi:MAG: hypothetical protein H6607_09035 [Flavobacteriales bacterium]|nr:hypothetical protein [Flavobacteriales bacterium]